MKPNRSTGRIGWLPVWALVAAVGIGASTARAGFPDCNSNGIDDAEDIAVGTSNDCDSNGVPDECDPNCNDNFLPDACDISIDCAPECCFGGRGGFSFCGLSNDCNSDGVPDECEVPPGVILSVWVGGTGVWSDPANWCPPVVPDNDLETTYAVLIAGSSSNVSLDMSPTINTLTIDNHASLLTFGDRTLNVLGEVVLDNGGTYGPTPPEGRGMPNSTGLFAGMVTIRATMAPGFMNLEDLMTAVVFGDFVMDGMGAVCMPPMRGGSSPPRLQNVSLGFPELRGESAMGSMVVYGHFRMIDSAEVLVGNDASMVLFGNWENLVPPNAAYPPGPCFDWTQGNLAMDCFFEARTFAQTFELGGFDFGPVGQGYVDNFAMNQLRVEPYCDVAFVDFFDNVANNDCEVHYVRTLSLGMNSVITLGECNVYYEELIDEGATIIITDGGRLVQIATDAFVDIKPGACPNSFNRGSHGVLSVAVLGTADLDVSDIDISTMRIFRADGVGGSAMPNEGPPGPHTVIDDVGTPYEGEMCACHDLDGDDTPDLSMKFRTDDVVAALMLDDQAPGALVELVVLGELNDGTAFAGTDCVRLVPPGTPPGMMSVQADTPGAWIAVTPPDLQLDGGGFGEFERTWPQSTLTTLSTDEFHNGKRFVGWRRDGQFQSSALSMEVTIAGDVTNVDGVFRRVGDMNGDERVDLRDFAHFAVCYGRTSESTGPYCTPEAFATADLDRTGEIDLSDFGSFAANVTIAR